MAVEEQAGMARTLRPYVCAGTSACFASFVIHPIDVTKVRLQVVPPPATAWSVASGVLKAEGVRGLYAGLSAALWRQATYGTARLGLQSVFSQKLKVWHNSDSSNAAAAKPLPFMWKFAASFTSGAIASIIGNPFDVALVRMQSDTTKAVAEQRNYKGVMDALVRIVRTEGAMALYRGYPPSLLRAIAMNVGQMTTYDEAKERYERLMGDNIKTYVAASLTATVAACTLSLPFDMMKTRLQNQQPDPKTGKLPYNGVVDCAYKIATQEGVGRFWRGYTAFLLRCAPHGLIILVCREYMYQAYDSTFSLKT